jgi:glycosyltransferase involved in cell wall biosynthesis
MQIAMIARSTLYSSPGGDTIQVLMTAKYLRFLGIGVDVYLSYEEVDYSKYNLLHFFNIIRPDDILPHTRRSDLPYVISTIFVDYSEYDVHNRTGIYKLAASVLNADRLEYLKALARYVKNGDAINSPYYLWKGHRASIQYVTRKCRMLLPNSNSEFSRFFHSYRTECPFKTIPNAIDHTIFNDDVVPNNEFAGHVLCVGRIEGRKNQLNLINALKGTNIPLTIIGKPAPNHQAYYNECRRVASAESNMQIIEHIDHADLARIYKAAKVHVLPSWFETTGLSSLEAGVMDCNVVVTRKGDTEEYFSDLAYYCEPNDISSIRNAVLHAYNDPVKKSLKQRIKEDYTWERAAAKTLEAYLTVLN